MLVLYYSDVEAALPLLEEHCAALLLTEVIEDFSQYIGEIFLIEEEIIVEGFVVHPADVKRRAVHVARTLRGITVDLHQLTHSKLRPCAACHHDAIGTASTRLDGVGKGTAYVFEQYSGFRHEVGHRVCEAVEIVGLAGGDFHQWLPEAVGIVQVADGFYAVLLSVGNLHWVSVIKNLDELPLWRHGIDAVKAFFIYSERVDAVVTVFYLWSLAKLRDIFQLRLVEVVVKCLLVFFLFFARRQRYCGDHRDGCQDYKECSVRCNSQKLNDDKMTTLSE